jgi:phosphoribosylglycinamide formyltransferase 1
VMTGTRLIVLTGSELRHRFVSMALALARDVTVLRTYRESAEGSLVQKVEAKSATEATELQRRHLLGRAQSERDFFGPFVGIAPDHSAPVDVPRGWINSPECLSQIKELKPDVIAAYGCSLIRGELLTMFPGRLLNVHLGLSPYYRGAGTNFWPLVNDEPEYIGATFMHIDAGIDTGRVIHQMRAISYPGDSPHQIGNRLISDMARVYGDVVSRFGQLADMPPLATPAVVRVYRMQDLTEEAVKRAYDNLEGGMLERYARHQTARDAAVPILRNPSLADTAR